MSDPETAHAGARADLLATLQSMDDEDFEYFLADLWSVQGWDCDVSQKSQDKSLDVMAERDDPYHQRHAIQAKRYQAGNNVSGPTVSEISSLTDYFDADLALIVTTSDFTSDARDRADQLGVKLIDGKQLVQIIKENDALDLVDKYVEANDAGTTAAIDSDVDVDLSDVNDELAEAIKEKQHQGTRALERAQHAVRMNPHDAGRVGIWDELPEEIKSRRYEDTKGERVAFKNDLYFDADGEVFVEDLRDYIPAAAIKGIPDGPTIAIVQRGVSDWAWGSDNAERLISLEEKKEDIKESIGGFSIDTDFSIEWDRWHELAIAGFVGSFVGVILLALSNPEASAISAILGLIGLIGLFGGPFVAAAGVYFDAKQVSEWDVDWQPSAFLYTMLVLVVYPIGLPAYIIQRRRNLSQPRTQT